MTRTAATARHVNRGRILSALRRAGPTPRVMLAKQTKLSFAAVSAITSELIAEGALREGAADQGQGRGRPAVELDLDPSYGRVVAVALRMNRVDTLAADFCGRRLASRHRPAVTREVDEVSLARLLVDEIEAVGREAESSGGPLLAIGIACQGMVDPAAGRSLWSPALSGTGTALAAPLQDALGVPVVMANDAVAVSLAVTATDPELVRGLTATIMVGHGVGMSILVDGRPAIGDGGVASEIGHVKNASDGAQCRCGQRGCIEASLADYALYRDARTFIELPPAESQQPTDEQMTYLRKRAAEGDPRLAQLFHQAGRTLADAVAVAISVFSPRHVVLAGPGLHGFAMMREGFEARLRDSVLPRLLERTTIHVRPCASDAIVEGMVRRTLDAVDRHHAGFEAFELPLADVGLRA